MLVEGRLAAEGCGVLVGYDYAEGRSTPLPDPLRERLLAEAETDGL
jgi:acyl-CoA thioesterase FadM